MPGSARSKGSVRARRLGGRAQASQKAECREVAVSIPPEVGDALARVARANDWTIGMLIEAAWGLVLGRLVGQSDVVFGYTVTCRPAEVPGIESMIGLLINTVPVRVRLRPGAALRDAVDALRDQQAALLPYQHLSLAEIQRLAGVGPLFDTLVVFENFPVRSEAPPTAARGLRPRIVGGRDTTHYPLTLVVAGDRSLRIRCTYRTDVFTSEQIGSVVRHFQRALRAFSTDLTSRSAASIYSTMPSEWKCWDRLNRCCCRPATRRCQRASKRWRGRRQTPSPSPRKASR